MNSLWIWYLEDKDTGAWIPVLYFKSRRAAERYDRGHHKMFDGDTTHIREAYFSTGKEWDQCFQSS